MPTILRPNPISILLAAVLLFDGQLARAGELNNRAAIVSHIKVLSDKVADVSSLDAWKKSFIKEGMSEEQKAIAIWRSNVAMVYQDAPPIEFLHEACVHDAIKEFNVYGYGMCCCASARVEQLSRYLGLPARGQAINGHSVPELFWDNHWHMLDASLVNYFNRGDGTIADVNDICQAVQGWLHDRPNLKGDNKQLTQFQQAGGWTGWKKGPALLANCQSYDWAGWWPAKTHGWYSTMQEYDGRHNTPFMYEYGYSQGYEVNTQLRRGERLVRNWFNKGLHVNGMLHDGDAPGCLTEKVGEGSMAFLRNYGDLTDGRIGSGRLEYDMPLGGDAPDDFALENENVASKSIDNREPAIHLKDASLEGHFDLEMPTSYVYLTGRIEADAVVPNGGKIRLLLSDNHGLDWRELATIARSGPQSIDISKQVLRRYDYRLRAKLQGKGTGLNRLRIEHDIQCSQRALPTLGRGENTITFSSGPSQGTVTIEGSTEEGKAGKQITPMDFHPVLEGIDPQAFRVKGGEGSVTFNIATPGDMTRLHVGGHYRVRDNADRWNIQVSYDSGRTFKTVDTQTGPYQGICKYVTLSDVPAKTRAAQVRWVGTQRNTTCLFLLRIDADYAQPRGGFSPVKVTYLWEEDGIVKKDVHIAKSPQENYKIICHSKPTMKSIVLELAE